MRSRLAAPVAALLLLGAGLPARAAGAASGVQPLPPGGVAAIDEPVAAGCQGTAPPSAAATPRRQAIAARALLQITGHPLVAGRRVSLDTDVAAEGCLTLTLYPRGARRLDAATAIGTVMRAIGAGPTRSTLVLNARGRRLLRRRHGLAALLVTDFRASPGGEVTLSTPVWL